MSINKTHSLTFLLLLYFCKAFSQDKVDVILKSDTINFSITTSGCWGGGDDSILIVKQTSDKYLASYTTYEGKVVSSTIEKKELLQFGELFKSKMNSKEKCGCTLHTTFTLSAKSKHAVFKTMCCGDQLPDELFKNKLKLLE